MFMNKRRLDIILKGSLLIMWIHCAFWIATVSTSAVAINASADSLSHKPASPLSPSLALAASGKIASNAAGNNNRSSSAKPPTTKKPVRFLDDYGELPGVQKDDDDDYDAFINTTIRTTTVRVPTQEKEGAVNAFLAGARPSVNGNQNRVGETGDAAVAANKTSGVLKKSLPTETGSVNRTIASSNPGKNSTKGGVQQVAAAAAAEINSTKLPTKRDLKGPNDHDNLPKVPTDKKDNDKRLSTAIETASAKSSIHQRVEVNASSHDKQKPTVRNGNSTKISTLLLLGVPKTKDSGVNTSKAFSTTPDVTGNGTNPLGKVTVVSKLNINITSKTNIIKSSVSKDIRDHASEVKTFANRDITAAKNHTATRHSIEDIPLKRDASDSSTSNDSRRIAAKTQSSKPSVVASDVTSIASITNTSNQTSKTLKFKSVLKIDKSNTTHAILKGKASDSDKTKHKTQPAPISNIADAGRINKTNNLMSEIINTNRTLKSGKSVATSNVTTDKTNSAGNAVSIKTLKIASNLTGTNNTNKAGNKVSTPLKLKNTLNLDTSKPLSVILKSKESNVGKLNSNSPKNTTGSGKTTKASNQTSASLTLKSVLKIGMSKLTINVTKDKGNNAGNMKNGKKPATISNVSDTGTSSKTINKTPTTSNIKVTLKANKSNTSSNVTKEKIVDSRKDKKPSAKTSNTTGTGTADRTNDHTSATGTGSIKAALKTGTLNAAFNTSKDKEKTSGNVEKRQSVVNLNMTATGNIAKTSNQTATVLVFKSSLKTDKSDTTSDLTKDKSKSIIGNVKSDKTVKSDKIFSTTSNATETKTTATKPKTSNNTS